MDYADIDEDYPTVMACRQGDTDAFNQLVLKHQKRMYNIAYRYVLNSQDAEEVVQDSFFSVYRNIARFRGESRFSTFLTRVVINKSLNLIESRNNRSRKNKEVYTLALNNNAEIMALMGRVRHEGEKSLHYKAIIADTLICIGKLSKTLLEIYVMQTFEKESKYDQLAEIFQINTNTAKSRVSDARKSVRACIEDKHGDIKDAMH